MKYKIDWSERKTVSGGKNMIKATLVDVAGEKHEDVAIWEGFPDYENLMTGHEVEGDIVIKQNGQYTNRTLYTPKQATGGGARGVKAAQDRKENIIKNTMDRKENGIEISATARDATLIVTTFYQNGMLSDDQIAEKWLKWRRWLLAHFGDASDITETKQPF